MVSQSLVRPPPWSDAEGLGGGEQSQFISARESLPLRLGFARRSNAVRRTAEGKRLDFEMNPAREMPDACIRAREGRFRNSFACGLSQEFARDGCVPLLRMVVSVELCVENEKAREVATLRVDRGGRLAGDLGYEVRASERSEAVFALRNEFRNIMLLIMCGDDPTIGHVFRNRSSAAGPLSAT